MTKISRGDSNRGDESSTSNESNGLPSPKSFATNKVKKSPNGHKLDNVSQDEMQSLLAKLKELVPNIPRNKKLSKLEIIQHVIDYIFDLQLALESHPSSLPQSITKSPNNSTHSSSSSLSPSNRQPLAIKWVS
jgi:hypothetical protein